MGNFPTTDGNTKEVKNRALLDATAGALAGAIARFVVGPLDVLKIRFQVQLEPIARKQGAKSTSQLSMGSKYTGMRQALITIVREEGVQGLWRGTVPGQLLTIPYTAVQFVALQQCRTFAKRHGLLTGDWAFMLSFVSGAVAGSAATVASYPFDVLRTVLAAQGKPPVYRGMLDAARGVVKNQGIRGLYSGLSVTLVEIVPYAALQFGLYDLFTAAAAKAHADTPVADDARRWERFCCGLAAGTLAKLGTHPLDVCKKRFQVAGLQRSLQYGARVQAESVKSLPACLKHIWQREGLRGLYKGSLPSILKAAPSAAVTFTAYEFILGALTAIIATDES
ncbi:mitochondrial thiamine diphosphate carrier 1 [Coccomyxa sp. Obi]|nr:mitochondrial thiamine diphosphate carrier 1 [Coccomyxa sp. Obi]